MAFEAVRGQLHQLRGGREIPVGVLGVDMPEIGRQQGEPRLWIMALPIGVKQRAYREPMTLIPISE